MFLRSATALVCALVSSTWVMDGQAAVPLRTVATMMAQGPNGEMPSLAPMLDQVTPAVVNISTRSRVRVQDNPLMSDPFFRRFFNIPDQALERETQSLGSGVVVDAKRGYVITNNHVIDKADEITVVLRDRRHLKAKLVGTDPETDIAVIQVPAENLAEIALSDSDKLRVGDFVVAIGNPFGLGQTVTSGIVSALGRSGLGIEGYEDFIQTDASINPGNSGGALVNLRGELVGVNTAILSPGGGGNVGIGFAIPINLVRDIMEQLVGHGKIKRGRLGVMLQDLTPQLATAFGINQSDGAVVSQIVPGSPADKAGLKAGDVLVSVNDRLVRNSADLRNFVGLMRVGQSVKLDILRQGAKRSLNAVITPGEQVRMRGDALTPRLGGAEFGMVEEDGSLADRVEQIQVVAIERNGPAWQAGLRQGDLVVSVNRLQVRNFDEFKQAAARSRRGLLLNIQRGEQAFFLLLQ